MKSVRLRQIRRLIGLMILLISLAILLWGLWPPGSAIQVLPVHPSDLRLPGPMSLVTILNI